MSVITHYIYNKILSYSISVANNTSYGYCMSNVNIHVNWMYEQCEHTCELNVWEIAACSNWVIARNWLISCFKHVGHTSVKNVQASHQEPQIHTGSRSHDQAELGMHHTFSFFADSFYSLMFWMSFITTKVTDGKNLG